MRITVAMLLTVLLAACTPAGDDSDQVAELEERVAELEAELAEARAEAQQMVEGASEAEADEPAEETGDRGSGSRRNPIPRGQPAQVGDWEITVADVIRDATEQVMANNEFNDPPAEGRQFFMVTLQATYVGDESGQFWIDQTLAVVGEGNVTYTRFEDSCGSIPNSIDDSGEAFEGGQVSGNACWSVASDEVDSLVMFAEGLFGGSRVWFALDA